MKISNETKIGILAIVAIAFLVLGFNFLKGKNLFDKNDKLYAVFPKVTGLLNSNAVYLNGLQVGRVYDIKERTKNINDGIVVTINLSREVNIPANSVTYISSDIMGTASMIIEPGNAGQYLQDGDTINTMIKKGMLDEITANINPTIQTLDGTLQSLDSLIQVAGTYFDPATKNNFHKIVANLSAASHAMNRMITAQNSSLNRSLDNVNTITSNLAANNDKITGTLTNVEKATGKLANVELEETVAELQKTVNGLNAVIAKANATDGSLGLLLNDKKLYNNLENTTRSMNILLDDIRMHPKRYINVSVFGRKDKSTPLTAPLEVDSVSLNAPKP